MCMESLNIQNQYFILLGFHPPAAMTNRICTYNTGTTNQLWFGKKNCNAYKLEEIEPKLAMQGNNVEVSKL